MAENLDNVEIIMKEMLEIQQKSKMFVDLLSEGEALSQKLGGFLRTFGVDQIKMGIWYGVDLPVMFSIPFALLVALLLFFCATYIKRSIVFCLSIIRI